MAIRCLVSAFRQAGLGLWQQDGIRITPAVDPRTILGNFGSPTCERDATRLLPSHLKDPARRISKRATMGKINRYTWPLTIRAFWMRSKLLRWRFILGPKPGLILASSRAAHSTLAAR